MKKEHVQPKKMVTVRKTLVPEIVEKTASNQQKRVIGRPFPPGVSGNPLGRPLGSKNFTTLFVNALRSKMVKIKDERSEKGIREVTAEEALIEKVLTMALQGKERIIELAWAYMDGKPSQPLEVSQSYESSLSQEDKAMIDNIRARNALK